MTRVGITTHLYLDERGERPSVGGVQTYLRELTRLCRELGWESTIFQYAACPFERDLGDGLRVVGVPTRAHRTSQNRLRIGQAALQATDPRSDLVIFGSDSMAIPTSRRRVVAIQHGVFWDVPIPSYRNLYWYERGPGLGLRRILWSWKGLRYFLRCPNRVCVDYNFYNWVRSIVPTELGGRVWVIPNFAPRVSHEELGPRTDDPSDVRILFARRFERYRGTALMAAAARTVLARYPQVQFTFAGEGPEEASLRREFDGEPRVTFTRFLPEDALRIHRAHAIAIVPSFGSEGTSLSLLEAMAAGCACLATMVGGMTNMILDGYNGLLVKPDIASLEAGLVRLIESPALRRELGLRAQETSQRAFGIDRWKDAWRNVLLEIAGE